jgi:large subunit ribosomal protein L25
MSNFVVNAAARNDQGKGASRRLRREGLVPGVVYGGSEPAAVSLENRELVKQLEDDRFYSSILNLKVGSEETRVILKDLQRHPSKPVILHADFQRVNDDTKIKIKVPVAFVNFEKSAPAKAAAKFAVEANVVEITCLPKDLPEQVSVDLSQVEAGQILHLSDIALPEGVEIAALRRGEDHDQGIGYVYSPRGARAAK